MKNKIVFLVVGLVALVLVLGLLVKTQSHATAASYDSASSVALAEAKEGEFVTKGPIPAGYKLNPNGSISPIGGFGVPSIRPHLNLDKSDGNIAKFDESDVRQYIQSHELPTTIMHDQSVATGVDNVTFVLAGVAAKQLNTHVGVADGEIVCVVNIYGSFAVASGPDSGVKKFSKMVAVFDGLTGNLLLVGEAK